MPVSEFRTTFARLGIGERFIFASEIDFPHSGIARGPWIKQSARKYALADNLSFVCRVGSLKAKVILLTGKEA